MTVDHAEYDKEVEEHAKTRSKLVMKLQELAYLKKQYEYSEIQNKLWAKNFHTLDEKYDELERQYNELLGLVENLTKWYGDTVWGKHKDIELIRLFIKKRRGSDG